MDVTEGVLTELELDGSNPTLRLTPITSPYFPSFHAATNQFFFSEAAQKKLWSMNYDDTNQTAIITVAAGLNDVSIDATNSKLYYAIKNASEIRFCDFDGSNDAIALTPASPTRVKVDISGGKCYWAVQSAPRIYRDTIPGGGASELLVTDTGIIEQFDLDLVNGKIYWSNSDDDLVRRCDLDGSNIETIVTSLVDVWGCAVDGANGKVYYTEGAPKNVKRANLDGSSQEIIWSGLTFPGYLHIAAGGGGAGARKTRWGPYVYLEGPGRSFGQSRHSFP